MPGAPGTVRHLGATIRRFHCDPPKTFVIWAPNGPIRTSYPLSVKDKTKGATKMLAIPSTIDRTSCPPTIGTSDRSRPGHGGATDIGAEGVIYYSPDGDGYILYATTQSTGAGTVSTG